MHIRKLVNVGQRSAVATVSLALMLALAGGCPGVPPTGGGDTGGSGDGTGGGGVDPGAGSPVRVVITTVGQGAVEQSDDGNTVVLTAVPASGFEFAGWSGTVQTDENPLTVDITEVPTLSATFAAIPPPVPDADDDGVPDATDNCANAANADQADADADGFGDVCDNCPNVRNPSQSDSDGDGIATACDNCPAIANADQTDGNGDGTGDACEGDRDDDSVPDDVDNCIADANADQADADGDTVGDVCDNCPNDANADQADGDNDDLGDICDLCPADTANDADRDGVCGDVDTCPGTAPRAQVDANGCALIVGGGGGGTTPICGNATVEAGEQCDDGNTVDGDGCSASCQVEPGGLANDNCDSPTTVTDGATPFNNLGSTDDGPDEPGMCTFFGDARIQSDVWFGYTASCSGELIVSLCGSSFDSKMAVYAGNACPTAEPAVCSDDDCGPGATSARVAFQVVSGAQYLIRVGGFEGAQGDGTLSIRCGVDVCAAAAGDCFAEHGNAGCSDTTCCTTTCDTDPFCCDVTWDSFCSNEAAGLCTGSFPACAAGAGACDAANGTGGCDGVSCCNTVCINDPFCCITEWDDICAAAATGVCGLTCGAGAGSCFLTNGSAGCQDTTCCQDVCATNPFCCDTTWDQQCVDDATAMCR